MDRPKLEEILKLYSKKDLWNANQDKIKIIDKQDQQIHELQEQLSKAIELPCKIDDVVYWIDDGKIKYGKVFEISFHIDGFLIHTNIQYCLEPNNTFKSYEEAEKRLAELKGEVK